MTDTSSPHTDTHSAKLKNYYRFHSLIYDATRWTFLFGRRTLLNRLPELPPRPRIMEIGCGTGKNIEFLESRFPDARILGVDLSADMLQKATAKVAKSDRITLVNEQYGAGQLAAGLSDLILCSYSLTMAGDKTEVILQQIHNDLKPEGCIAVVDFHTTPRRRFKSWMKINHVDLNGRLLPLLNKYFQPSAVSIKKAYFGLWTYFTFLGKRS